MRIDEAVRKAKEMEGEGLTELHIVNGLHPNLPWRYYPNVLRELKSALPEVKLKCFTAIEILHLAWLAKKSVEQTLRELKDAGLVSLTGGGADGDDSLTGGLVETVRRHRGAGHVKTLLR